MTKALIDADILKYQLPFASQKEHWTHAPSGEVFIGKTAAKLWMYENLGIKKIDWGNGEWSMELVIEPWEHCRYLLDLKIDEIISRTNSSEFLLCFSPKVCFRDRIATVRKYKDRPSHRPHYYKQAHEYLIKEYPSQMGEDIEADDLMGQLQTSTTVICTTDKDLDMIAGEHYNFNKDLHYVQDPFGADNRFYTQLISGDAVDTIQGIPGWGEAKAAKLVDSYGDEREELVHEIRAMYEDHYPQGSEIMEEMAALVWILRRGETPETAGWRGLLNHNV